MVIKILQNLITMIQYRYMSKKRFSLSKHILKYLRQKKARSRNELFKDISSLIDENYMPESDQKSQYKITRALKNLEKKGDIESLEQYNNTSNNGSFLRLTSSGRQSLRSIQLDDDQAPIPQNWDGKWRIIILDLPESRKEVRNALRYILKKANFACVKNSLWISPYPLEHMLENMKKDLELTHELMIIVTDEIDEKTVEVFKEVYSSE